MIETHQFLPELSKSLAVLHVINKILTYRLEKVNEMVVLHPASNSALHEGSREKYNVRLDNAGVVQW